MRPRTNHTLANTADDATTYDDKLGHRDGNDGASN